MKLFILFLALFALSQAAPAPEAFTHGLAHLSRQKRDEQAPVKSSSEIGKAAEAPLPVDADKLLHQQEEVKKPNEPRQRREGHDDLTLVSHTPDEHDEEPKTQDSQGKTTGPTSKPKREAHHEEGHDVTLVAKTLEGRDEEPKTQDSQDKTTGPTSAPKTKRETDHEEGHEVKQEPKKPEETPVLAAVPAVAPSVAPVTKLKREATEPPPVKPASVIAAEHLIHNPHRQLETPTPLPELSEPSKQQQKRAAHHEEGHHGDEEKAKKGEDKEKHVEHRHQRDIPVPTEVKTTNAPATTKATDEGSNTSAFPLRHRPKPVAELFHQQEKSATTKPTAAHSSSEESSE